MRQLTWRHVVIILLAMSVAPAMFVGRKWKEKGALKGQAAVEPFRIAGNFYYVGANDETAYLLTGPEGHVLLNGGYATTAPMIMGSIATLGFDIKDVRILIASAGGDGGAGGLHPIQQASGAELWASDATADVLAGGGQNPDMILPLRILSRLASYTPPRVDHRFKDGDVIRLGPIALTAHITPGSSRGCTSWSFPVKDGERVLNVVSVCSLIRVLGQQYPEQADDLERSFRVLRSLPADIWVTSHARLWGRYRKFVASKTAANPVDAFIDPEGYYDYIDAAEVELRTGVVH